MIPKPQSTLERIAPTPTYDANGNQLTATPATLTWNALAQPIAVNSTTATYDALGRMVETGSGSTYKQFVFRPSGALLAVYSSGLVKGTIPLPGGETAIYNASGLNYIRHKDWLGSSRLATTWNHAVYSKEAYAPFGETYNEAGTPDRSFTGQDQDVVTGSPATGVYDFLFRKYDPSAGRWLSPDPAGWGVVNQADPQSLDRYAYLENQPLSLIDPEGLAPPCPVSSDGVTPIGQCSNPSNPPPASAPNNGNQSSWQQKMRQAAHYMCGNSPADRVATSVKCGAAFGAVLGAVTGFVGGEVFGGEVTFGATGLVGAYLGAHVGGAVGAINGLGQGVALAGICYAGFMYDNN